MSKTLNILLLEDEQRAGEKLINLIEKLNAQTNITWKRSVTDGLAFFKEQPTLDLIFSDIELLDGNVFQLYESITPDCPIIFCTAYNQYYVDAFKTSGIAYLLKPYSKEQFQEAWDKYLLLFEAKTENQISEQALPKDLISSIKTMLEGEQKNYKNTFAVKKKDGVFLLNVEDISFFQAQGDFVLAIDGQNRKHIINSSLSNIENSIDPKKFFRINRSEIVRIGCILKYNGFTKNRLAITLSKPQEVLYTSNSRAPLFREWIEGQ